MKMSTRCRYGLRSLADLAVHGRQGLVSLAQIAERQNLSQKYLEQEFAVLRRDGFVRSVKGAQGGYVLARDPAAIRVGDVIRSLEGDLEIIDTLFGGEPATPIRRCLDSQLWQPLNAIIRDKLDDLTLADLLCPDQSGQMAEPMYYI
jgi:Rrf2 family cysteine metabolism transcriptional repressor